MMCSEHDSLDFVNSLPNGPYNSSLATSASSSSTSVWSDASQSSDDTSYSTTSAAPSEQCDHFSYSQPIQRPRGRCPQLSLQTSGLEQSKPVEVPQELRQNPRRTSNSTAAKSGCPPALVRQSDRKVSFVDSLVDSSTRIVEAIWPLASVFHRDELGSKAVLPLRTFIQETLRRSRTSYSTLQVALYYLILIKPHVPSHDFTMEQPNDGSANKVLQCGRRMFLAALILASKYLQDRNYSARAWSKISGLATLEINQNEMTFLTAVEWNLHITDEIFQRWTEIVLKYVSSSQPPSPRPVAASQATDQRTQLWRNLLTRLNPKLDNIEELIPVSPSKLRRAREPLQVAAPLERTFAFTFSEGDATPTPKSYITPAVMEPAPATVYTPGRFAPALGLLPTPRLTPQSAGFSTPAVNAATCMLGVRGSMSLAVAQAAHVSASQNLDRWPVSNTSPQSYYTTRRSSLANSLSNASSPESMISDSSRTSRSSSISSASSLATAPSTKLDVQARCRNAKLYGERYSVRPAIASVPEDYEENCITSSPDSYTGTVGKDLYQMSFDIPLAGQGCEMDDAADAARALQDLRSSYLGYTQDHSTARIGSKRARPSSIDNSLYSNVRDMLSGQYYSHAGTQDMGRKRVCYSSDAPITSSAIPTMHPAVGGVGGPGMWAGILN
ncbi:Uu.00g116170.m01.CDS01 [Anthostomella pinea]|uniref:Uu.00g116170.m01.CDS01 n=1 Tax=Anthostomella pinea TaxID=933095 RepID=A0AAI8VFW1_9PEZI|nr:Uu.00g116170.m01.CDS01 [Anthostomella pinea]